MRRLGLSKGFLCAACGALAFLARGGPPDSQAVFKERAEQAYREARVRYHSYINDAEAAWQFGRACFDLADLLPDAEKGSYAEEGSYACRQALLDKPDSAWAHYYLGLDLGELASSRGLGALPLLHQMEDEWKTAIRLDEKIDYAGPNRSLGMLYRDAPHWPLSIGNKGKAIHYLTDAVRLSPDYPDNLLTLAEAYLKWNDYAPAGKLAVDIPNALARARTKLTGPKWEQAWGDWDRRWQAIQARLHEISRPQTPHAGK